MNDMTELMKRLAPVERKKPILPDLTPHAELALLCRVLFREGYNDHIAGHISYKQPDGTLLMNPWELAWDEVCADDVLRIDANTGKVLEGNWNITPAVNVHVNVHAARGEDVKLVIHNHSRFGSVWASARRVPPIYDQTSSMVNGELRIYDEYRGTVDDQGRGHSASDSIGDAKWALLANHGVMVVAGSISQAYLRAATLEWRCRHAWHVEALGGAEPLDPKVAEQTGAMTDGNGFPFMWEAEARRELRAHPEVLASPADLPSR
jgi:ribulose-5-phosphate 4-epimerase/fuculose-1-phosphate aldolase